MGRGGGRGVRSLVSSDGVVEGVAVLGYWGDIWVVLGSVSTYFCEISPHMGYLMRYCNVWEGKMVKFSKIETKPLFGFFSPNSA